LNITQETGAGRNVIRGYERGRIIVNERSFSRSLIVSPEHLNPDWEPQLLADLQVSHLEAIAVLEPQVVLLGTGDHPGMPEGAIPRYFLERGIGFEAMATRAACRTFNVLMSEGRAVAAALLVY
jgi:uncharacterized protein